MNKSGKIDWKKFVLLFTVYISKNEREGKKRYLEEFFFWRRRFRSPAQENITKKIKSLPPFSGRRGLVTLILAKDSCSSSSSDSDVFKKFTKRKRRNLCLPQRTIRLFIKNLKKKETFGGLQKTWKKKKTFDERNPSPPQQEKFYVNSRYLSFMYILLMYTTGYRGGAGGREEISRVLNHRTANRWYVNRSDNQIQIEVIDRI